MVLRAVSGSSGSGGSVAFGSITGDPTDNASLVAWGATLGGGSLPAIELTSTAGDVNITFADCNRGAWISETGPRVNIILPDIATDPDLEDQALLTIWNYGPAILLPGGADYAEEPGAKLHAFGGEIFQALYLADTDSWALQTPDLKLNQNDYSTVFASLCTPGASTLNQYGINFAAIDTATATSIAQSAADLYGHFVKLRYNAQAAGINRAAGVTIANSGYLALTAAIPFRWRTRIRGAVVDTAITDGRFVLGFGTSLGLTSEPSTMQNAMLLYADSTVGPGQLLFGYNDAAGSVTPITLNGGAGFPATAGNLYQLFMEAWSNGTVAYYVWIARNLSTGVKDFGVLNGADANMPVAGTQMVLSSYRNSGPSSAAALTAAWHYGGAWGGSLA